MSTPEGDRYSTQEGQSVRGLGSAMFAAIMLLIIGTLNVIYGIAAVADSSFYVAEERYVFGSLHTWGWITIILGRHRVHSRAVALRRQRVWAGGRDRGGDHRRDWRATERWRPAPVVVTRCLRGLRDRHPRPLRARRTRKRLKSQTRNASGSAGNTWHLLPAPPDRGRVSCNLIDTKARRSGELRRAPQPPAHPAGSRQRGPNQ